MKFIRIILVLLCCGFNQVGFASISSNLMRIASLHPKHRALESHSFVASLKKSQFRREQLAQFFADRIYILEFLEKKLFPESDELSEVPEVRLFFRSRAYREELRLLVGTWTQVLPSKEAIAYREYLQAKEPSVLSIHLWLLLIGDTFGAQHLADYFHQKFTSVGVASKSFEDLTLINVRHIFNLWITRQLEQATTQYEEEIGVAYDYLLTTFEAAERTPNVNFFRSVQTVLSERFSY